MTARRHPRLAALLGAAALAAAFLGPPSAERWQPEAAARAFRGGFNPNHQCSFCHDLHGNVNPTLLNAQQTEDLCLTCHGPGGISSLKAATHKGDKGVVLSCLDCHHPHKNMPNWLGGTNLKMVGRDIGGFARIATPNSGVREVVFESRGTSVGEPSLHSFADGDEDGNGYYDGVCETCHTKAKFHRNDPSGNHHHNTGKTCTNCHEHAQGFKEP